MISKVKISDSNGLYALVYQNTYSLISRTAAILVAVLLHVGLYYWYQNRPAPLQFTEAAPLPMISMVLSAPATKPNNQPIAPPQPKQIVEPKKVETKPQKKLKPKLPKRETAMKQVEKKEQQQEQTTTTALPTASSPPASNHQTVSAPRMDTFTPADSDANYLNNPKPEYPMVARQRHWEGLVLLRVFVTADGHAAQVVLQRSSGHEALDESALEAVKNWRFAPAKRGDFVEASWATVPIDFSLE